MILGRNAGLWTGLGFAILDTIAAAVVLGQGTPISPAEAGLFLALHAVILSFVGLVANVADPSTVPTFALTTSAPTTTTTTPSAGSSTATGSPPSAGSDATTPTTTTDPSAATAPADAAPLTPDAVAPPIPPAVDDAASSGG